MEQQTEKPKLYLASFVTKTGGRATVTELSQANCKRLHEAVIYGTAIHFSPENNTDEELYSFGSGEITSVDSRVMTAEDYEVMKQQQENPYAAMGFGGMGANPFTQGFMRGLSDDEDKDAN